MLDSKTVLTAVVGFAFVALLLACPNAKPQTISTPDPHWTVHYLDGQRPGETKCGPLQDFSKDAKPFERNAVLVVPRRGGAVKESVETKQVGEIMGFAIYEVLYHLEYPDPTTSDGVPVDGIPLEFPTFIKMILVQRKAGEYCEIFNEQDMEEGMLEHDDPYIVNVQSQPVLVTRDPLKGTGGLFDEAYWTFDKDGPVFLDLSIIRETEEQIAPFGFSPWHCGGGFDLERLTYTCAYRDGDDGGGVSIRFALKDHKLVVVNKKFDLNQPPNK